MAYKKKNDIDIESRLRSTVNTLSQQWDRYYEAFLKGELDINQILFMMTSLNNAQNELIDLEYEKLKK